MDRYIERIPHAQKALGRGGGARARARAPPAPWGMQLREASFHIRFLRLFAVCFSATGSFHVASRAFGGWLFCPQGRADAGLPYVPPNCSLDF